MPATVGHGDVVEQHGGAAPAGGTRTSTAGRPHTAARPHTAGRACRDPVPGGEGLDKLDRRGALPQPRHGREQGARVLLARRREQLAHRSRLDDPAVAHHHHVVREVGHHAHVVRDEQHGRAALVAQPAQQVEDPGLDGDVQRRRRLVGDDRDRLLGEPHRDERALELTAGKLMRVGRRDPLRVAQARLEQQLEHALVGRTPVRPVGPAPVRPQRLGDLVADGQHGVPGTHRLLRDEREHRAPHLAERLDRSSDQLSTRTSAGKTSTEPDRPGHHGRLRQEPEHRHRRHRLARAGLANQRRDPAGPQCPGHAVDGGRRGVVEHDGQPLHLQEGLPVGHQGAVHGASETCR